MKFFLVKEHHVVFPDLPAKVNQFGFRVYAEKEVSVPVELHLDEKNMEEYSQSFLRLLKGIIHNGSPEKRARKCVPSTRGKKSTAVLEAEKQSNNLLVQIGIYDREDRDFVRIADEANVSTLETIGAAMEIYKLGWKIGFKMEKYTHTDIDSGIECTVDGYASGIDDLEQITSNRTGSEGTELLVPSDQYRDAWVNIDDFISHNAVISIFCEVSHTSPFPDFALKHFCLIGKITQRILTEEIMADTIIRTKDNADIKCHSSFLAVQSDVLEKAFGRSFEESKTKVIEMPDMSSTGVKALLAFLYYADLEKATETSATAVEVLQASHKYNVGNLEQQLRAFLASKPDEWFDVEAALKLFLFARLLEQDEHLKLRAVKIIKANFASVESSSMYDELFKKNPELAKELFKDVCKV